MSNEISSIYVEEQRRVLERALSLPLPDAVFAIVNYNNHHRNMGPRPHCDPIPISVLRASGRQDEIEAWIGKVIALRSAAYRVGDALLRKDGSYEPVRARFEIEHPGFSANTYDEAISYGCFAAR